MKTIETIENAVVEFFADLDAERFERVAERLDPNVELADELTGEWLRGAERVGAYLRAQTDIVTDVTSRLSSLSSRWLGDDLGLVTFIARQRYRLDSVPREETLTGAAIFSFTSSEPRLLLFHLGEPATAREPDANAPGEALRAQEPRTRALGTVGGALRQLRGERGLSLRALGARSGLSPSFLSQIERGVADPSITSLRRLAEALNISILALLGEPRGDAAMVDRIVRRHFRRRVVLPDSGLAHELLTSDARRRLEVRIETLEPGVASSGTPRAHTGEEFLLVLEGALKLAYGEEEAQLHPGDSVTIDARMPHRLEAVGGTPLRVLMAVSPPP